MNAYQRQRYLFLILGNIIIGLGIAIFIKAQLGIDPFTLFNRSISRYFQISFSVVQWTVGLSILLFVVFIDRSKIYIGTLINLFLIAPIIEGFNYLVDWMVPTVDHLAVRIVIALLGCTVLSIGAGMYLASNLGMAPYDLIAILIGEKTPIPFKWARIGTDALCVICGFFLGGEIGVGTLLAVFGMGPIIGYVKQKSEHYLEKMQKITREERDAI